MTLDRLSRPLSSQVNFSDNFSYHSWNITYYKRPWGTISTVFYVSRIHAELLLHASHT